jgi:acyl carrier protein
MNIIEILLKSFESNSVIMMTQSQKELLLSDQLDMRLTDFYYDSLARMELSIWFEVELGLTLNDTELSCAVTFHDLVNLISSKLVHR